MKYKQRAKSHDQRKGQWLINKIRSDKEFRNEFERHIKDMTDLMDIVGAEKEMVELKLWNMENDEFDKLMSDYNE